MSKGKRAGNGVEFRGDFPVVGWVDFPRVRGMDPNVSRRKLRNPNDLSGLPRVRQRRAIPAREVPLDGTRKMLNPREGDLRKLVAGTQVGQTGSSRGSRGLGWVAMVMAGMTLPVWIGQVVIERMGDGAWYEWSKALYVSMWVVFFAIHSVVMISLAMSDAQETLATKALMLYWLSVVMIFGLSGVLGI